VEEIKSINGRVCVIFCFGSSSRFVLVDAHPVQVPRPSPFQSSPMLARGVKSSTGSTSIALAGRARSSIVGLSRPCANRHRCARFVQGGSDCESLAITASEAPTPRRIVLKDNIKMRS